ncbi:MAG: hypothetical protein ISN29_12075, partial [Gammaproteobacteria bacterium AqS3]|nr:hypothetical protein [Gammaproteobacteria bacterium AqS3]
MNTPMIDCTAAAPGTFRPPRLALLAGLAMMLAIASSPPASAQPSGTIEVTAGGAVNEGSTLSLRVTLSVEPASDVVIKAENSNPSALSVSPSTITLTTGTNGTWNTGRNFQFRGLQDDDSDDATVIVTLSIESGGFTATNDNKPLTFSVQDDDPGLALSDAPLTINEGGSGTFKVKLKKAPSGDVTVALTAAGDLTLGDASLTFTTSNWNVDQTVAVTAGQDSDYDDDTERISLSASGGGYDNVSASASVTVTDDDTPSGNIEVTPAGPLTIAEGASGTLMVRLSAAPKSDVTVTLAKTNDDVTLSGATLSNSALT